MRSEPWREAYEVEDETDAQPQCVATSPNPFVFPYVVDRVVIFISVTARTVPLPGEFDNLFTPVIIRGQRR